MELVIIESLWVDILLLLVGIILGWFLKTLKVQGQIEKIKTNSAINASVLKAELTRSYRSVLEEKS